MDITFRPYNRDYKKEVDQLFEESFEGDSLRNIFSSTMCTVSYVAFIEDEVIGLLFAWENPFHPEGTYFRLLTEPEYTTVQVKKGMFNKLREEADRGQPFITSVMETAISARDFYERNGFKEIRRTFMPTLAVDEITDSLAIKDLQEKDLKSLREVMKDEGIFTELAHLVKENYEISHIINPVRQMGIEEWKELIASEDTLLDGSFIQLNEAGETLAYSFLHESDTEDTYELGWCGSSDIGRMGILPFLVGQQIHYARKKNIKYLLGEFDTTDPFAMEVMRGFSFKPLPAWISYKG